MNHTTIVVLCCLVAVALIAAMYFKPRKRATFTVRGTKWLTEEIQADSVQDAARKFKDLYGVQPDRVTSPWDEYDIVGQCESCNKFLTEREQTFTTGDDVTLCQPCGSEFK